MNAQSGNALAGHAEAGGLAPVGHEGDSTLAPAAGGGGPLGPVGAMGGVGGVGGFDVGAAPARTVSGGTVLLVASTLIAGVVLWGMRTVGLGPGRALASLSFDKSLVDSAGMPTRDHAGVLADLNASRVHQQVPEDKVKRNPFLRLEGPAPAAAVAGTGAADEAERRNAEARRAEEERQRREAEQQARRLEQAVASLKLNGVMGGSSPVARINGEPARVGDRVAELFTLSAIHQRSVELKTDEGVVFMLEMGTGESGGAGARPRKTPR